MGKKRRSRSKSPPRRTATVTTKSGDTFEVTEKPRSKTSKQVEAAERRRGKDTVVEAVVGTLSVNYEPGSVLGAPTSSSLSAAARTSKHRGLTRCTVGRCIEVPLARRISHEDGLLDAVISTWRPWIA